MKSAKLWRQNLRRYNFNKIEIKKMILCSIKNNKNIDNSQRSYALFKTMQLKKYKCKSHVESCLLSGKSRGVWKFCYLGRHKINELNKTGALVNIRASSW